MLMVSLIYWSFTVGTLYAKHQVPVWMCNYLLTNKTAKFITTVDIPESHSR